MAVFNEALLAVYVTTCGWVLMPSLAGGAQISASNKLLTGKLLLESAGMPWYVAPCSVAPQVTHLCA